MTRTSNKAADFLKAMQMPAAEPTVAPPAEIENVAAEVQTPSIATKPRTRAGLKHFGGYLDDDALEKIALLRVRLKKDNSELIKLAIDELYRKHNAKRAFGDA